MSPTISSPLNPSTLSSPRTYQRKPASISMIRQTYSLAHLARGKLSYEASRADHNLRLLVGHANLLDNLMIELAEAEAEQEQEPESWFDHSVQAASLPEKKVQWASALYTQQQWEDELSESESSDSSSDADEGDMAQLDDEVEQDFEDDMEEDYESLSLSRTASRSSMSAPTSPPELSHSDEEEDSSDDEALLPTPPPTSLPTLTAKQREQLVTTSFYSSPLTSGRADDEYLTTSQVSNDVQSIIRVY